MAQQLMRWLGTDTRAAGVESAVSDVTVMPKSTQGLAGHNGPEQPCFADTEADWHAR